MHSSCHAVPFIVSADEPNIEPIHLDNETASLAKMSADIGMRVRQSLRLLGRGIGIGIRICLWFCEIC